MSVPTGLTQRDRVMGVEEGEDGKFIYATSERDREALVRMALDELKSRAELLAPVAVAEARRS